MAKALRLADLSIRDNYEHVKYLKSKLFTSLFAILLILSFCMAKPAQVHASNADSAKMARWMSICSSMADNIEKKYKCYVR